MNTNTEANVVNNPSSPLSSFQMCQSSGPSFDLTLMPEFADLVPGIEPVNLTLKLRVGVTDSDGVSTVIGSYKNNSISEWTNVSMSLDDISSDPDDYVAWALNDTMSEPSFLVIWDIKFYANDSLNNWNVSGVHQMSICRQGGTNSSFTDPLIVPLVVASISVIIVVPVLYVMYRRRTLH